MNWSTAVILVLGSVSCSLFCAATPRYYRSGRYGYSGPSHVHRYSRQISGYGSNKYGGHRGGGHHHHHHYPHYVSKIKYTGKVRQAEVLPGSKFGKSSTPAEKRGRITKRPTKTTARPVTMRPKQAIRPKVDLRLKQQDITPKQMKEVRVKQQQQQPQAAARDIQTNVINTDTVFPPTSAAAPAVQQKVLAPVPAVPDRPVQQQRQSADQGRTAAVPARLPVPAEGRAAVPARLPVPSPNESILPNMILEAIPAVPDAPLV
eukprot:TRINITY_DN22099_c0_g1_i1.p1 TRINITY_DN22099_c0_g1~~TRINITY_DN22099_c0_g1_i1.p1  ORF type:complete len:261 (+),score=76.12 TRINITY_DN22099_c0_g1_i1:63-845(+)